MKMRLNKKHIAELHSMLGSAMNWHMIFWMQDDQDLEPEFRRRELQRRKRWRKAMSYFNKILNKMEKK